MPLPAIAAVGRGASVVGRRFGQGVKGARMIKGAVTKKEIEGKEGLKILSPSGALEAVIFLSIAIILDLIGLVFFILSFFGIGIIASWILDIIGLVIFAPWSFFRSGKIPMTKKLLRLLKRVLPAVGVELIPFAGDIAFGWTVYVLFELAND